MVNYEKIKFRKGEKFSMDYVDCSSNLWRSYYVCIKYENMVSARFGSIGYVMGNY